MNKQSVFAFVTAACTIGSVKMAAAICRDDVFSQADFAAAQWLPCGSERTQAITGMEALYDFTTDDWHDRGDEVDGPNCGKTVPATSLPGVPGGPNNVIDYTKAELGKHLNAFMLIANGVDFTRASPLIPEQSFHASWVNQASTGDYLPVTAGDNGFFSDWHAWYRDQIVDTSSSFIGNYDTSGRSDFLGKPPLMQATCVLYDHSPSNNFNGRLELADPVMRASVFIHEGWHAWEIKHGKGFSNICGHARCSGPIAGDASSCVSGECDQWYPHTLETSPGGMNGEMHRPYQAMVEFACDIVDTPSAFVPDVMVELAAADADYFANNDFLGGPMPGCWRPNFGHFYKTCQGGAQCDEATPCLNDEFCSAQSGCCIAPPTNCTLGACPTDGGTCANGGQCDLNTGCCEVPPPLPK